MIQKIIDIVKESALIMEEKAIRIDQKGNASNYVTSTDIAVQDFLTKKLQELEEGSTVLGEEGKSEIIPSGKLWIIDPIDGTSNYIRDMGLSVISVAYVIDRCLKMSVVYNPYRDEMFFAVAGQGAFLNGKQIHVSDRDFSHSHLCSAMSLYDKTLAKPCFNIIEKVYTRADDLRRLGSAALELSYLAAGRVELFFEIKLNIWDVAAAMLLVKEAGGEVRTYKNDPLPLDKPFAIYAANSIENLNELEKIIYEEIPSPLY